MNKLPPSRVVIVDDNDLMRTVLRGILRNENHEIVGEARTGLGALEVVEREQPEVVFLDVMMPEMDGLEALMEIKERYPATVVVMVTGNPSKENVEESIQNGAGGSLMACSFGFGASIFCRACRWSAEWVSVTTRLSSVQSSSPA